MKKRYQIEQQRAVQQFHRLPEHQVSRPNPDKRTHNLSRDVARRFAPTDAPLAGVRQRNGWIEMRPRDRAEG